MAGVVSHEAGRARVCLSLYQYKSTNTDAVSTKVQILAAVASRLVLSLIKQRGAGLCRFTSTKVQILTRRLAAVAAGGVADGGAERACAAFRLCRRLRLGPTCAGGNVGGG